MIKNEFAEGKISFNVTTIFYEIKLSKYLLDIEELSAPHNNLYFYLQLAPIKQVYGSLGGYFTENFLIKRNGAIRRIELLFLRFISFKLPALYSNACMKVGG